VSTVDTRAIFIRHGQSTANIGEASGDFSQIPLTALGQRQAEAVAQAWTFTPGLIVVSPFLRTQQTARPTIERFRAVPVETWPIEEFAFWDRQHWSGSRPEDQKDLVDSYWSQADPDRRMGQAESFAMLIARVQAALDRLATLNVSAPVLLFTHGHFLQVLRRRLTHPALTAGETMQGFREFDDHYKVRNTELIEVELAAGIWRLVKPVV
jgi:broad specificity phosphatase PhoE